MTKNELALSIHATPDIDVTRAALHSFYDQGEGLVAALLVLEHRVSEHLHQATQLACRRWLLSHHEDTSPDRDLVAGVYRRMAKEAINVGAQELHVEFPRQTFTREELTPESVRQVLAVDETVEVYVYADDE